MAKTAPQVSILQSIMIILTAMMRPSTSFLVSKAVQSNPRFQLLRSMTSSSSSATPLLLPQAAVSVGVRCRLINNNDNNNNNSNTTSYYLMIQRGKAPNKGKWSIPGGRLHFGETAFQGGVREVQEETKWQDQQLFQSLQWYKGTVCSSDYIGQNVHYLIAQCFAELSSDQETLPMIEGDDDADDADWFRLEQVKEWSDKNMVSEGVYQVFCRMEEMANHGFLPTTETPYRIIT